MMATYNAGRREVERALRGQVGPHFMQYYQRIAGRWSERSRPDFVAQIFSSADRLGVDIYPVGPQAKIWRFVSEGTRPHRIPKQGFRNLAFMWGGPGSYAPRTSPGGHYGGPGKASGKRRVFKFVMHPGTKPRRLEKHIARWGRPRARQLTENAMRRGIRRYRRAA